MGFITFDFFVFFFHFDYLFVIISFFFFDPLLINFNKILSEIYYKYPYYFWSYYYLFNVKIIFPHNDEQNLIFTFYLIFSKILSQKKHSRDF